jgi:hypothetical protein
VEVTSRAGNVSVSERQNAILGTQSPIEIRFEVSLFETKRLGTENDAPGKLFWESGIGFGFC